MKVPINWDENVIKDYRKRIIVDPNNPILAFKANRDRYTKSGNQSVYAGLPYLGSRNSEDALTWNVFRSLQMAGKLNIVSDRFKIGQPRGILLWTLAPDIAGDNAELQYVTGSLIREYDGIFKGQTSEPDVIILGTTGIAVIECKLSEPDIRPPHLWEGEVDSVEKRLPIYKKKNPNLLKLDTSDEKVAPVYQLMRMAFFAGELGSQYKLEPLVISLANNRNWSIKTSKQQNSATDLWDMFLQVLGGKPPRCECTFWQDIHKLIDGTTMGILSEYLLTHSCL